MRVATTWLLGRGTNVVNMATARCRPSRQIIMSSSSLAITTTQRSNTTSHYPFRSMATTTMTTTRTAATPRTTAATAMIRSNLRFVDPIVRSYSAGVVATAAAVAAAAEAPTTATATTTRGGGGGGAQLAALVAENPHIDVVRYEHKNRIWTVRHVNYYAEAMAIGFLENGFQPGDIVLSWLPEHFSETMVLQFACSKAGLILYHLDPSLAIKDPAAAQQAVAAALQLTNANIFISQEAGSDVSYAYLVEDVIPELRLFEITSGMPFITPRFPHLRMCIHTGFEHDDKIGWYLFKHFVVPSNNLDSFVDESTITANTPLAGTLECDVKGIPVKVGPTFSHTDVIKQNMWPTYGKILQKQYHEVAGVGVVF